MEHITKFKLGKNANNWICDRTLYARPKDFDEPYTMLTLFNQQFLPIIYRFIVGQGKESFNVLF